MAGSIEPTRQTHLRSARPEQLARTDWFLVPSRRLAHVAELAGQAEQPEPEPEQGEAGQTERGAHVGPHATKLDNDGAGGMREELADVRSSPGVGAPRSGSVSVTKSNGPGDPRLSADELRAVDAQSIASGYGVEHGQSVVDRPVALRHPRAEDSRHAAAEQPASEEMKFGQTPRIR
jgi:hypothetical protein